MKKSVGSMMLKKYLHVGDLLRKISGERKTGMIERVL
jgi:hypothetical protein